MALDERHRAHANSFGAAADVYERGRPQYPPEAIDWLVPARATRVADVGAGTGKLTRSYVITLPDAQRHRVLGRVRHLIDTRPSLPGSDDIALRMVTHCSRADLPC